MRIQGIAICAIKLQVLVLKKSGWSSVILVAFIDLPPFLKPVTGSQNLNQGAVKSPIFAHSICTTPFFCFVKIQPALVLIPPAH
ncbi:hypothetical protein HY58_08390 [Flavihumibacter sp. ZG627]|nr:hypothetical protein HY58_08390 [Flavihumibacter sp. ZG627]